MLVVVDNKVIIVLVPYHYKRIDYVAFSFLAVYLVFLLVEGIVKKGYFLSLVDGSVYCVYAVYDMTVGALRRVAVDDMLGKAFCLMTAYRFG